MKLTHFIAACAATYPVVSQQIFDVWQTKWDRSNLFSNISPSAAIDFVTPGTAANADIIVDDTSVYQSVYGFGGTLTDSSAKLLSGLKSQNSGNYNTLMNQLFNPADGQATAGMSYLRVPLGSSDFSDSGYTFVSSTEDSTLSNFNINNAPSYLFSTIADIQAINPYLRVHVLPWSPPSWMKSSKTLTGGSFVDNANYLLKSLQGFQAKGITPFAISIQNEPENSNPTYPSCLISPAQEAAIGGTLRTLMNNNGFSDTKIIGFEHNWNHAGDYPITLMQDDAAPFAGVSFHCYAGAYTDQATFHNAYPNKEIYFTECTGSTGSDWWSDIKWAVDNLYVGTTQNFASTVLMWNIALSGAGGPEFPGSNSCVSPTCRGIVTINSDGSYVLNQEYYSIAQNSRAVTPKDTNGPWGKRIGVSVAGGENWALRTQAYVTERTSSSDWNRYSLVVLNWDDSSSTTFNPVDVKATIEFRGVQAAYTFPVGVTTLWWYAAA